MAHKTRALVRKPRENVHVAERYTIGNGTPNAVGRVSMLSYNIGTCPNATVENPHNKGTQPENCDHCFVVA